MSRRVIRGGSYYFVLWDLHYTDCRYRGNPEHRCSDGGFRLVVRRLL